jgi:Predicted acyl-CoA transferases/carnitine dehydratase
VTVLLEAVAAAGDRLVEASRGKIDFDVRRALSRSEDLSLGKPGLWSPNRNSRLIACRDGWIAVSLARDDDRDLVPAWTGASFDTHPWDAVIAAAARRSAEEMAAAAIALHLPVAVVGETRHLPQAQLSLGGGGGNKVIDLSALWAGPYCAGLLAEAGFDVVKIESPARPDPTARHTPALDARINGAKRRVTMALENPRLMSAVSRARVLVTSARPHALAHLGLDEATVFARNPGLLWIAVTAHGWRGPAAMRVGFGDDCAAAGGLVEWRGAEPSFMGDALADPLTGMTAAILALEALAEDRCGLLDVPLAGSAARFAEVIA